MGRIFINLMVVLFIISNLAFAVENSTISVMEKFECIENIPTYKFSKNQWSEIVDALEKKEEKIRLVTYNMLFNLYDHHLDEENRWPNRLPRIVELIQEIQPDIICTQELYPPQAHDLSNRLENDFAFFEGQKDADGESYGIFYRKERFELLSSQVKTPVSIVQLKDLKTGKIFSVFNTHLSFANIEKREMQAREIVQIIAPVAERMAVIFAGDLNTFSHRMDLDLLPFYDGDYIHRILSQGSLKNSQERSLIGHFGPISTFTNRDPNIKPFEGIGTPGVILDYIYTSEQVTVLSHATERGTVNGHFPSDHLPVLIDFLIQ